MAVIITDPVLPCRIVRGGIPRRPGLIHVAVERKKEMEVNKMYLVTACGNSKKTKQPYTIARAIRDTPSGQWLDEHDFIKLDVIKPVGTKLRAKTTLDN